MSCILHVSEVLVLRKTCHDNYVCECCPFCNVYSGPSSSTGVVVCAGGDGAGECVSGGATALGGTYALPHRLWHCTVGTARLCSVCHGDSVETAPQDL